MKTLIISDLHGDHPISFIRKQQELGIERVVSLGDYDAPEILEKLLGLEMNKLILLGNHDYGFVQSQEVWSLLLHDDPEVYVTDWAKPSKAREYALASLKVGEKRAGRKKGQKIVESIDGRRIVYVHGCLVDYQTTRPLTWGRIISQGDVREGVLKANFNEMRRLGYDLMFRGHDHFSIVFGADKKDPLSTPKFEEANLTLDPNRRYIVSVGSFENGEYAIFDDKEKCISLKDGAWRV